MSNRESITDITGAKVVVGDRVAAACTGGYSSGANLVVGRVERFTASRTVIRVEERTGYSYGDFSTVHDGLGRIIKLAEEVTE